MPPEEVQTTSAPNTGMSGVTSSPSTPVSTPTQDIQSAAAVGASPASGVTAGQAGAPTFSITGYLSERGYPKDHFQSDEEAFRHILGEYQAMSQQARDGQHYRDQVSHLQALVAQLQQVQQGAQPQSQAAKAKWHGAPEYDPLWTTYITRGDDGELKAMPGAPADVLSKWQAFKRHQQAFGERFAADPIGSLKQGLMEEFMPAIKEELRAELSALQNHAYVRHVASTADFAYEKDANGNILTDLHGNRRFTPEGNAFMYAADVLHRSGVTDVRAQDQLARLLAAGILATQQARSAMANQQTQPATPAPNLAAALRSPSHAGSTIPAANTQVNGQVQNRKLSFQDMLRNEFRLAGVTDDDINRSPTRQ